MKFIKITLDVTTTMVIYGDNEIEMDFDVALENVRSGEQFSGYLFYPGDKPSVGCPIKPDVSREEYLKCPAKYGIAMYKTWNNQVVFE